MKIITIMSLIIATLSSCSSSRTVYISNRTGKPIILLVDSSYKANYPNSFQDSLDALRIEKKKVLDFGKGKWTKEDKESLQELIRHTKIRKDGSAAAIDMPAKTTVSHISLNVEELWLNIK